VAQREGKVQRLELFQAVELLLEECRMVLPGVQALFGFQLIVVFNAGFSEKLDAIHQQLHLAAIVLIVIAIVLLMTPAAYHRQTRPDEVSEHFLLVATRLVMCSMPALALGFCIDLYIVARTIVDSAPAGALAALLFLVFAAFWYVLPRMRRLQGRAGQG
jgi:hypothetical protein